MRLDLSGLNRNIVLATLLCVLSLMAVNRFAPEYLNADTLLFSVMSIQNVTPFIWGQDRLANFIPYLLSPISTPHLNLFAHLWLFSLSFFLLLLGCARRIVRLVEPAGESDGDLLMVFVIAVVVSLLTLSPSASYVFILEGQPYAASYLLLFVAFFSLLRVSENAALNGTVFALALFTAIGLNFSILIPAGALACGYVLIEKKIARGAIFLVVTALMFAIWMAIAKRYGVGPGTAAYSVFNFDAAPANMSLVIASIRDQISHPYGLAAVLAVTTFWSPIAVKRPARAWKILLLMWLFVAVWLFVFSNNAWIRMNGSHFRYFFPFFLALIFHVTYASYLHIRRLSGLGQKWLVGGCLLFVISSLARPLVTFSEYAVLQKADSLRNFSAARDVHFVAGNYWDTWPLVFEMLEKPGSAFSFAYRSDGNRLNTLGAFDAELTRRGAVKVLCLTAPVSECVADIDGYTQRHWKLVEEKCPDKCSLLLLTP